MTDFTIPTGPAEQAAMDAWNSGSADTTGMLLAVRRALEVQREGIATGAHAVMQVAQKALIVDAGRMLMVHYGATGNHDWDLPGGRVEAGERDLDDALIREVKEETGLLAIPGRTLAAYVATHSATKRDTLFLLREVQAAGVATCEGQVPEDDIADVCWVPVGDVMERNLNPCLDRDRLAAIAREYGKD